VVTTASQLTRALSGATIAGTAPESVGHYAVAVLSAAYRRGFHQAAKSMAQAAEQLPQDALFEHLLVIGRAQRGATERLHAATTLLVRPAHHSETTTEGSPPS